MEQTNPYASEGVAEEKIGVLDQLVAIEMHLKTLLDKEEGRADLGEEYSQQDLEELKEELTEATALRREVMRDLFETTGTDQRKETRWCLVKHYSTATMRAFEVWQASGSPSDYNRYRSLYKLYNKTLTRFLGYPVTECAACFADMLNGFDEEEIEPETPEKIRSKEIEIQHNPVSVKRFMEGGNGRADSTYL